MNSIGVPTYHPTTTDHPNSAVNKLRSEYYVHWSIGP